MGQRVQLLVKAKIVDTTAVMEKAACYHNQWGIGKNIWKDVIALLLKNIRDDHGSIGFPYRLTDGWNTNEVDELEDALLRVDFDSKQDIENFVNNYCDMDNGVVVLQVTTNQYGYIEQGKLTVFDSDFNEITYDTWYDICSCRENQDEDFDTAFKHITKMYNINYKQTERKVTMFELTKEQAKRLAQYPHLNQYVNEYIANDGQSTTAHSLSSLTFFFKMMCINNSLDEQQLFGWDEELAEDFYSWGSNSRWANVFDAYLATNFNECIDIALDLVENYGDSDIYENL